MQQSAKATVLVERTRPDHDSSDISARIVS